MYNLRIWPSPNYPIYRDNIQDIMALLVLPTHHDTDYRCPAIAIQIIPNRLLPEENPLNYKVFVEYKNAGIKEFCSWRHGAIKKIAELPIPEVF